MNIAEIIQDALRGRPPRRGTRHYHQTDHAAPADFLKTEVWPLLKNARELLESRGHFAIATRPAAHDQTHTYSLLILDSSCQNSEDACFLRFLIFDEKVNFSMRTPVRRDKEPRPLDPQDNVLLVEDLLTDFIFYCLSNKAKRTLNEEASEFASPPCSLQATG